MPAAFGRRFAADFEMNLLLMMDGCFPLLTF